MPSAPPPSERRAHARVLHQLDAEWMRLHRRHDAVRRPASWRWCAPRHLRSLADELTAGLRDLDDLVAAADRAVSVGGEDHSEEILRWLIRAARRDRLAARVVLQRVVRGVIGGCRPDLRHGFEERIETALGTAWLSIRTFDLTRRRGPAAAAIVSDATRVARHGPRARTIAEVPRSAHLFDLDVIRPPANDSMVELARTVRTARRAGVPTDHLDLLRELASVDQVAEVADRHGVSTRAIRFRRERAITSVRDALGDGWCPTTDAVA